MTARLLMCGETDQEATISKLLDHAFQIARALPETAQDEIARMMLAMAEDEQTPIPLSPEDEASFAEALALALAERGEFVAKEEIDAFFAQARR